MSFDAEALGEALSAHGRVARVVVAEIRGSTPREVGASMLVWPGGQSGSIGGGALEHGAARDARAMLAQAEARRLTSHALGPDLGQCCGGAVTLLAEVFEPSLLARISGETVYARPAASGAGAMPLAIRRLRARARDRGEAPAPGLHDGWMIEHVAPQRQPLWIWGAGHVGRALVDVLAPLPHFAITWLDTGPERFPASIAHGVTALPAPDLAAAMRLAPRDAHHLILTYSHALDFALCDAALAHGFASAGLIGSATKRARFRTRLHQAGHEQAQIDAIHCPIGDPGLGKHPQAIAVGVSALLLRQVAQDNKTNRESPRERGNSRRRAYPD